MGGLCFRQWPGQPVDLRDLTACRWFAMDRYRKRPVSGPQDRGPVGVAETSGSWQNPSARRAFASRRQPLAWHGRLRCRPPRRARRHARVVPEGTRTRGRIPRLAGCGPVATDLGGNRARSVCESAVPEAIPACGRSAAGSMLGGDRGARRGNPGRYGQRPVLAIGRQMAADLDGGRTARRQDSGDHRVQTARNLGGLLVLRRRNPDPDGWRASLYDPLRPRGRSAGRTDLLSRLRRTRPALGRHRSGRAFLGWRRLEAVRPRRRADLERLRPRLLRGGARWRGLDWHQRRPGAFQTEPDKTPSAASIRRIYATHVG